MGRAGTRHYTWCWMKIACPAGEYMMRAKTRLWNWGSRARRSGYDRVTKQEIWFDLHEGTYQEMLMNSAITFFGNPSVIACHPMQDDGQEGGHDVPVRRIPE